MMLKALDAAKKLLEAPDAELVVLLNKADEGNPASYSEVIECVEVSVEGNIVILIPKEKS